MMCSIQDTVLTCKTASQGGQCNTSVASCAASGLVKQSSRLRALLKGMMAAPRIQHTTPREVFSQHIAKSPAYETLPGRFTTSLFDLTLSRKPGKYTSVVGSSVPSVLIGKGYGRKMYGGAIRNAYQDYVNKGGPRWFTSDTGGLTSASAERLWGSLRRRGYPVEEGKALGLSMPDASHTGDIKPMFGIDLNKMKGFYKDSSVLSRTAIDEVMSISISRNTMKQASFLDSYSSWKEKFLPDPVRDGLTSSIPVVGRSAQKMMDFDERGPDYGLGRDMYIDNHPLKTVSNIASPLLGYRFAPGIINKSQGLSRMADRLNVKMLGETGSRHVPGLSRKVLGLIAGGLLGSSVSNGALSARFSQKHASQHPEDKSLEAKRQNATLAAAGTSFLPSLFNLGYKGQVGQKPVSGMSDDAGVFEKLKQLANNNGAFVNTGDHIPEDRNGRAILSSLHGRGPVYLPEQNVKPELFSGLLGPEHAGKYRGFINFGAQKPTSHMLAHELGHHMSPKWMSSRPSNIAAMAAPGLGMLPVFMSNNESAGLTGASLGTLGSLPQLLSELEASRRGKSMWRNAMGESSYKKLPMRSRMGTFHGLPTYMAMAAAPGIAYGTKKMLGGYDKPKQDNSLLNWSGKIPW